MLLRIEFVPLMYMKNKVLVTPSCLTLCSPMNCSPPGSSGLGITQVRIPEWVAIPFSRGSSPPSVSCVAGWFFAIWATREVLGVYGSGTIEEKSRLSFHVTEEHKQQRSFPCFDTPGFTNYMSNNIPLLKNNQKIIKI